MGLLRNKIESTMKGGTETPIVSFASILYMISIGYGGIQRLRGMLYGKNILKSRRLPCKVVSIGNIAVGGTGKTPMTIDVANRIKALGYTVVVISRGYKGEAEKKEALVSDGKTIFLGSEIAGDEPFMLACRLQGMPVIVGRDRFAAGMLAVKHFHPEVVVLDDGFQHLRLARDMDFVLLDYIRPFGNSHLLPRGILREPIAALYRSDACILTRTNMDSSSAPGSVVDRLQAEVPQCPVFSSSHTPYYYAIPAATKAPFDQLSRQPSADDFTFLTGRTVMAFSGIARNDDFRQTIEALNCKATGFLEFRDHHRYSETDITRIIQAAKKITAEILITTEKDYARIAAETVWPLDLIVIGVKISFGEDERRFDDFLKKRLAD
ncbi:MAG: tetraacyldisaccharide 4'-kinase [Desulfobacteraceae bacterium]|jgi:tetraacyldisaccharide 4'-kinase